MESLSSTLWSLPVSVERRRVLNAFLNRDHLRVRYDYNPAFLDMVEGTNREIAQALEDYTGLPGVFLDVVERHFGVAREYARMGAENAVTAFRDRVELGMTAAEFLKMADTVKDMPLDYAQPVLDAM